MKRPTQRRRWGDLGNGYYANPIINSDFSDPDITRVGDDFYMVASDFHFVGMQILHSVDLVNWAVMGQVFDRLDMSPGYDAMERYGEGTWAPSIRHHDGQFYVYVCTPREGLFLWKAADPAGPWSRAITVKAVENWEDPCPFWDGNGQAYLAHSLKGAGPIILHRMAPDGEKLLDDGKIVYKGNIAEGPKLYKRDGFYYIFLPENGVQGGCQTVLRANNIYGPYERRVVLPDGHTHQGGIVDTGPGESCFIGFKYEGYLGRVCHLEPVKWKPDGWPVFGNNGQGVSTWRKPVVRSVAAEQIPEGESSIRNFARKTARKRMASTGLIYGKPMLDDAFMAPTLMPLWQWNHNPVPDSWSVSERSGYLRLKALPAAEPHMARNTLTQKLWDSNGRIEVGLETSTMKPGQVAGLSFICGRKFMWVGVECTPEGPAIAWAGGPRGRPMEHRRFLLRIEHTGDMASLSYCADMANFIPVPGEWKLEFDCWKGARVGLFTYGPNGGCADFDYFRYSYGTGGQAELPMQQAR